jgi:hypothetical protein
MQALTANQSAENLATDDYILIDELILFYITSHRRTNRLNYVFFYLFFHFWGDGKWRTGGRGWVSEYHVMCVYVWQFDITLLNSVFPIR